METGTIADRHDLVESRLPIDSSKWRRFLELDSAICEQFFVENNADRPLYLDIEQDVLEACGEKVNASAEDFLQALVDSARQLMSIDNSGTPVFQQFDRANRRWFRQLIDARRSKDGGRVPPPPTIGLLTLFVIPAERMGEDGGKGGAHQRYYGPLLELLEVPEHSEQRFRKSFADVSEDLWRGLNAWLESEDGRYGLPTAFALSHRFVGLPVSQALIRETERRQLRRFFAQFGLQPSYPINDEEMQELLDQWISQIGSPASRQLKRLWGLPENQGQLASIALTELQGWDGHGFEIPANARGAAVPANKCRFFLVERRTGLFESKLFYGIALRGSKELSSEEFLLETSGEPMQIGMRVIREGLLGAEAQEYSIDPGSILEGRAQLRGPELERTRLPRKFVPLEFDELGGVWLEVDSIELGETYRVLVEEDFLSSVAPLLDRMTTGVWQQQHFPSIPTGWMVLDGVQFATLPPEDSFPSGDYQFSGLQARPAKRTILTGGLRLPGRIVRYSSLALPTVSVVSDDDEPLILKISSRDLIEGQREQFDIGPYLPPFNVPLSDHLDREGDYEILLSAGAKPLQSITLRLRSSNEPDNQGWESFRNLAHGLPDVLWPLRARPAEELETIIANGAFVSGPTIDAEIVSPEVLVSFTEPETFVKPARAVRLPEVTSGSCVFTGAHHFHLPEFDSSKYTRGWMWGSCKQCGLRKRFPANPKFAERLAKRSQQQAPVKVVAPEQDEPQAQIDSESWVVPPVSMDAAVDAIVYLGQGSVHTARQIARKVNDSALFAHDFIRAIEQIALVDIEHSDLDGPQGFELAPATLTTTAEGTLFVAGGWSQASKEELRVVVEGMGGVWEEYESEGFRLEQVRGLELSDVEEGLGSGGVFVDRAGLKLAERLPTLSAVGAALPRVAFMPSPSTTVFTPEEAKWVNASIATEWPGAYSEQGYATQYRFRSQSDIELGSAAIADPYTVKHLGVLEWGKTLLSFDPRESELAVPLGCDLPGLYGRAAVLESGVLPERRGNRTVYSGISEYVAELLMNKLGQ